MKICYILTEIANGGAERVVLNLCQYFSAHGDDVSLVSLKAINEQNPIYREFAALNIPIYSANISKWNIFNYFRLGKIIRKINPEIIHSHLFHGNILSRLLKRDKKTCRLVNTIHIMEYRKSAFWRFKLDAVTFKRCDVHTSVALSTAEFQAKKLNVPIDSFKIIKNGINLPSKLTAEKIDFFRKKFNLNNYSKVIGSVGRLDYQKGFDRFLELLPQLESIVPAGEKWAYLLIGDGVEADKLKSIHKKCHTDKIEVIFAGFYPEANSMIELFDCFIMPSRSEGYPLVLLEAMSHGVPILVNNISCIIEALTDYPNYAVTDFFNDSSETIAESLAEMLKKNKIEYSSVATVAEMAENYKKTAYL